MTDYTAALKHDLDQTAVRLDAIAMRLHSLGMEDALKQARFFRQWCRDVSETVGKTVPDDVMKKWIEGKK